MTSEEEEAEIWRRWDATKSSAIEAILGKEHDMVMHAMIPYRIGGGLDLYDYPHGIPGTAIATKELSELPGRGPSNDVFQTYELVMFTRRPLDLEAANNERTEFGKIHGTINAILNCIAPYSGKATLNPIETCEFPAEMGDIGGRCLIFDRYGPGTNEAVEPFGLLAILEIFRSEMDFAREHGGASLIRRLRQEGHYPYSDMDRNPVA